MAFLISLNTLKTKSKEVQLLQRKSAAPVGSSCSRSPNGFYFVAFLSSYVNILTSRLITFQGHHL